MTNEHNNLQELTAGSDSKRDAQGRFPKGVSGNQGGAPRGPKLAHALARLVASKPALGRRPSLLRRRMSYEPQNVLDELLFEALTIALTARSQAVRLQAIGLLFDRLEGRPGQTVKVDQEVRQLIVVELGGLRTDNGGRADHNIEALDGDSAATALLGE